MNELERLAAACLFPGFEGTGAPEWLRSWLDRGLGGVVLFSRNVERLPELTGELRAERPDLLVAIDEEGGDVTRLEAGSGSSYPGNYALGVVDDVELTEQVAVAMGSDLARAGVNFDLAPVADVNTNPDNPVIGIRSFGSDPALVARHVAAFVAGMQRVGVAACAKHFPGHGDTAQDSHLELPVATLSEAALQPFRAAIEAGVRTIMTAHVVFPEIDAAPATLSRALVHDLLRAELGFAGMVITDALEMRAVSATVGVEEGAVRALAAGADALCLGADPRPEVVARVHGAVVEAVRSGRLTEERLQEAAGRVTETARWASGATPDPSARRDLGIAAARRALEAEGSVTLSRPPLVVELLPEASVAAGKARHGLGDALRAPVIRLNEAPLDAASVLHGRRDRQVVVVVRDAHRHEWERAAVESLLAAAEGAIVVETGLPLWRPGSASGYLATHGAGRVNLGAAADRLVPPGGVESASRRGRAASRPR